VLILGTGAYAGVVVAELLRRDVADIRVHSGSGRAATFAENHPPVTPTHSSELAATLRWADVVVCCSGTGTRQLTVGLISEARRGRPEPLAILDLAVAGDVPPEVDVLPEVTLVDLDEVARHAPPERAAAVEAARQLVEQAVATFRHTEGGRQADPAVTAMRAHVSAIIESEITASERRNSPETAEAVARSLRRVSNALLHTPSLRAAELARTGGLDDYRNALHTLFGIDVEAGL
jgi:glutamyl-tRNA reductase